MRVLDLFSGLEGWSSPMRGLGWDVVTLDFDERFHADLVVNILDVHWLEELGGHFDLITASPPCEAFSTGSIGKHWGGGAKAYEPKTDAARTALRVVNHTFKLIDEYRDRHPNTRYVIENPRGVMRKITPRSPSATTWYCQWGERRAKPTDLWTNVWPGDKLYPVCHNGASDHDAQSRYYWKRKELKQTGGTQGLPNADVRALIPRPLALAVALQVEHEGTLEPRV